jgi:hypothetical protein
LPQKLVKLLSRAKAALMTSDEYQNTRGHMGGRIMGAKMRSDANPQAMRRRRETVEHPFGTMKARMGATHFLMARPPLQSQVE